ncbi:hypothetical protein LTR36_000491 [Oleoguttula mirabilis]|uniref:Uncharacterized protein n=1 Tax=Oleoguttula mirabilis TaxID=1507867 RepID=A0AAV9JRB6_9PEZI|nr:hypothetical protein LTR36_000491 [Oleoguttula mirabilis]
MAPTKERAKASTTKTSSTARNTKTAFIKKPTKVTKRSKTRTTGKQGNDLFMILPAELRNEIYGYVLAEDKVVLIGTIKGLCKHQDYPTANEREGKKSLELWREPGMLQMSKAVRAEASAMYYRANKFVARAKLVDFDRLGSWLKQLTKRCGPKLFQTFTVSVLSASWAQLHHAKALAKVFYRMKLQVEPGVSVRTRSPYEYHGAGHGRSLALLYRFGQFRIQSPINAALALGQQAAEEGWGRGKLDRKLKLWLDDAYKPNYIRKALRKAGNDYWGEIAAEAAEDARRERWYACMRPKKASHKVVLRKALPTRDDAAGKGQARRDIVKVEEVDDAN